MKKRFFLILLLLFSGPSWGYSVLTHEAVVDSSWHTVMMPLLRARFPSASEETLARSRKFAYGGCLIQDLGYYPFGNKLFSDLLHYVRSGTPIRYLLIEILLSLNHFAAGSLIISAGRFDLLFPGSASGNR